MRKVKLTLDDLSNRVRWKILVARCEEKLLFSPNGGTIYAIYPVRTYPRTHRHVHAYGYTRNDSQAPGKLDARERPTSSWHRTSHKHPSNLSPRRSSIQFTFGCLAEIPSGVLPQWQYVRSFFPRSVPRPLGVLPPTRNVPGKYGRSLSRGRVLEKSAPRRTPSP